MKPDVDIPFPGHIYQEPGDDLERSIPNTGYLVKWPTGVLMLEYGITVRAHMANSHHGKGWEEFTDAAIRALKCTGPINVFILWVGPHR